MKLSIEAVCAMVLLASACWLGGFYFGRSATRSAREQGIAAGLGVSKEILKELRSGFYLLEADPLIDTRPQWDKTDAIRIFPNEAIYTVYTNRLFTNWTLIVSKP